jgi:hypothetical protein
MLPPFVRQYKLPLAIGMALLGCVPGLAQTVEFNDGVVGTAKFDHRFGLGPAQSGRAVSISAAATGLSFFSKGFFSFSRNLTLNIVGTDPGVGAATTVIPTVIVPLKFVFPNTGNPVLDGTNIVATTINSPIFQSVDFTTGATDLGVTQYGDAIQRAEFWNYPGFSQSGYHVLLGPPAIAATVAVNVPSGMGTASVNSRGVLVGRLDDNYFEGTVLPSLITQYSANVLPIFVTDNVFLYTGGNPSNCCIVGFHNSESGAIATARTWIYSAYTEFDTFSGNGFLDVVGLSHEVAEWLNDPFVGGFNGLNFVPPFVLPGQGGMCQVNFETGDPLEALSTFTFTETVGGITYHLQDEALLPWFIHTVPSFSANEFYSYLGIFRTPSTLCGPG